jgi:threonylcarbamoyladenosine tRNA methylthiotransferase MtaB
MPQLPMALRRERAARLRAAGAAERARFLASRVGTTAQALFEADGRAHTEHFAPLRLHSLAPPAGTLARLRVTGSDGTTLLGELT